MTKSKIKAEATYTMQDIVRDRMFPWATSFWSVRNFVKLDSDKTNILKPLIVGKGRATKYHFKGSNIIKFIDAVEAGKVRL